MTSAICPDCGRQIDLGPRPRKGQFIACPHCNADLEIVSLNPPELEWAEYLDDELESEDDFPAANGDLWEEGDDDLWEDDEAWQPEDEEAWDEEEEEDGR
ncbi:MAG: hypothetical protein ACRDHL_15150 [Candidatus Promineifilaceae bacterium]